MIIDGYSHISLVCVCTCSVVVHPFTVVLEHLLLLLRIFGIQRFQFSSNFSGFPSLPTALMDCFMSTCGPRSLRYISIKNVLKMPMIIAVRIKHISSMYSGYLFRRHGRPLTACMPCNINIQNSMERWTRQCSSMCNDEAI